MKKYLKKGWRLFRDTQIFFLEGVKKGLFSNYLKVFLSLAHAHVGKFHLRLVQQSLNKDRHCKTMTKKTQGLHALLPNSDQFSYSILLPLEHPSPQLLKSCLSSACAQSSPHFEILIGSRHSLSSEISQVINNLDRFHPNKIKVFDFSEQNDEPVYNLLSKKATGKYLLLLEQEDWIRPDLLYSYELCLRKSSEPDRLVVNSFEDGITEKEHFIPGIGRKKSGLYFPYIFQPSFNLQGMLVPKALWDQTQGIRTQYAGAESEDLILRLDAACAKFLTIPLCLYSHRTPIKEKKFDLCMFIESLKDYARKKKLNWDFEQGYRSNTVRAIPQNIPPHQIQVIIPFKEQKELTLRCLETVKNQKGIDFRITAVDNGSADRSIGEAIRQQGGEVLRIDEPFNYSRLNNLAVANTKTAQGCDLILFLNNDVELDEHALLEMTRWIDQPSIGIVGARLHYPNGKLQHGGVMLNEYYLPEQMGWEHIERLMSFDEMKETKALAVVDAVTAACALIKKENFLKAGGFDEIWYPIAFSDTNLAVKLKRMGLYCFYTPYAFGIHHESVSRKEALEDVEGSVWFHELNNDATRKY